MLMQGRETWNSLDIRSMGKGMDLATWPDEERAPLMQKMEDRSRENDR